MASVDMTAEVFGRVFEPFFTTKAAGSGRHDGFINVATAPAQGTTSRVYFPVSGGAPRPPRPDGNGALAAGRR
jgi:signal transduction histidine kinase